MPHEMHQMSAMMQQCIDECLNCHRVCLTTIGHCLEMGGKHAEPNHIRLMQDCAQMCATSADFMLRMSEFHTGTCGVCADVCAACAVSCEQIGNDAQMAACAAACRRCAQSCREMASMRM